MCCRTHRQQTISPWQWRGGKVKPCKEANPLASSYREQLGSSWLQDGGSTPATLSPPASSGRDTGIGASPIPMPFPEEPDPSSLPHRSVLPQGAGDPQASIGKHTLFFLSQTSFNTWGLMSRLCQLGTELQRLQNCSHFVFHFFS